MRDGTDKIKGIGFYEILDTRGRKTLEAWVKSESGVYFASAPVGTSSGKHEIPGFPKGWKAKAQRYLKTLIGKSLEDVDAYLVDWKHEIGSTLSTAVSIAVLKAKARGNVTEYLMRICREKKCVRPGNVVTPVGKVVGGGKHSEYGPEFQEFLFIPKTKSFTEGALLNAKLYLEVGELLSKKDKYFSHGRDYESGWITSLSNEDILSLLEEVVPKNVRLGVDIAASSFYSNGYYHYHEKKLDTGEQLEYVSQLIRDYRLFYVEDPFHEDDFESFAELTKKFGKRCLVVGDDLFVTNVSRLEQGIKIKAANSIIIKPNQVGTFMETITFMELAYNHGYTFVLSHRSGETDDNFLAKMAVGLHIPYFKCGIAGERIVKINEVIREEKLWQR